jgi:hypothetical protein
MNSVVSPSDRAEEIPLATTTVTRRLWRRRRFLVNRGYQLRVTLILVATALILLLLLNVSLYASSQRSSVAATKDAPGLRAYFEAQDRFQFNLILVASLVFLAGVFALGVLETHKTAGASFNICRCLEKLRDGEYRVRLKLRRSDNLHEIESAFNDMAQALYEKTRAEVAALDRLAEQVERTLNSPAASEAANSIRALRDEKQRLL